MNFEASRDRERVDEDGLNRYIAGVFGWTFLGLFVTAATVGFFIFGLVFSPAIANMLAFSLQYMLFLSIAQFGLVMVFSMKIQTMKPSSAKLLYLFYAMSNGIFFTWVALSFNVDVLVLSFLITSISFGSMALYGYYTKSDLTSMGNILKMALIGLIISVVANIFMQSSTLDLIICIAGLFIFLGLTVYDTKKIKDFYYTSVSQGGESDLSKNLAIYSALGLYLNFINIFMFILRLLSNSDD